MCFRGKGIHSASPVPVSRCYDIGKNLVMSTITLRRIILKKSHFRTYFLEVLLSFFKFQSENLIDFPCTKEKLEWLGLLLDPSDVVLMSLTRFRIID